MRDGTRAQELFVCRFRLGRQTLNGLGPEPYLCDVLARIADHPVNRIAALLPWNMTSVALLLRTAGPAALSRNMQLFENENRSRRLKWRPVASSVFTAAAYRRAKRMFYLLFRSGELYCYFDFPPQDYPDFLAADSKGQYFSRNIRNRFQYKHLPHRRPKPPQAET